jgi:hypothetical protein
MALLTACHTFASAFQCAGKIGLPLGESNRVLCRPLSSTFASVSENNGDGQNFVGKENKAMSFLKKIGKVGGAANRDFRFAIGVDEGSAGKSINVSSQTTCARQNRCFRFTLSTHYFLVDISHDRA